MILKFTWMRCLIIGTSISLLLIIGCGRKTVEPPIKTATYVYYNKMTKPLHFEIKNGNNSALFKLEALDSATFLQSGELPNPFNGENRDNTIGDSVIINFMSGNCVTYFKDFSSGTFDGNGVFDLKEYDNYSQERVNQRSYTLRYSIDSIDYKRAIPCK